MMRIIPIIVLAIAAIVLLLGAGAYLIQLPTNGGTTTAMRTARPFFGYGLGLLLLGMLMRKFLR